MHDQTPDSLRKQALSSGRSKTVSRKAQHRQALLTPSRPTSTPNSTPGSGANSKRNSRATSRVPSRAGSHSDDEDDDGGNLSGPEADSHSASLEAALARLEMGDAPDESLESELPSLIDDVVDRNWKRSNASTRRQKLTQYIRLLLIQYLPEVSDSFGVLVPALLKSVRLDDGREAILALKALTITVITSPTSDVAADLLKPLRHAVLDSESQDVQIEAIYSLGTIAFFGALADDEKRETMAFFLEIISTDGVSIDAENEPGPVVAALEQWALLATSIDDMSDDSDDAIEQIQDQLTSSAVAVVVAAGEAIALLYEKAASGRPASDDPDDVADHESLRYSPYHRPDLLARQLEQLARGTSPSISRADRKELHGQFTQILQTVQNPSKGPGYSTALNAETQTEYGSRLKIRAAPGLVAVVDRWWQVIRLHAIKRALQAGFTTHLEENDAVHQALPLHFEREKNWKTRRSMDPDGPHTPNGRQKKANRRTR